VLTNNKKKEKFQRLNLLFNYYLYLISGNVHDLM